MVCAHAFFLGKESKLWRLEGDMDSASALGPLGVQSTRFCLPCRDDHSSEPLLLREGTRVGGASKP